MMKCLRASTFLVMVFGFYFCGCSHLPDDSPPEEFLEDVIEDVTGLDIDLTSEDGQ